LSTLVSVPEEERAQSKVYVRFIDILFAVVLGQSFVFLSSQSGISLWIAAPYQNLVTLLDVILAYTLVVTSWVSFQTSTRKLPIRNISRFIIDVVLLFLYYLTFVNVGSFTTVSTILTVVFFLYFAWEIVRLFEYADNVEEGQLDLLRRTGMTALFLILFFGVTFAANVNKDSRMEILLWAASFVFLFIFRVLLRGGPKKSRGIPPPPIYKDES
jgi:hypothetical protein